MFVRIYLRDALRGAISFLQRKYPHHTITGFKEWISPKNLAALDDPANREGFWGQAGDILWDFELEKADPSVQGPDRVEVGMCGLSDVAFHGEHVDAVQVMQVAGQPKTIAVQGLLAAVRNLEFIREIEFEKPTAE